MKPDVPEVVDEAPETPETPEVTSPTETAEETTPEVIEAIERIQDDPENIFAPWQNEMNTTGTLTEESIKQVAEKTKIPETFIRAHLEAQKRITEIEAEKARNESVTAAGGVEAWNSLMTWAGKTLSDAEISTYNQMLAGTSEQRRIAVEALKGRKGGKPDSARPLLEGSRGATPSDVKPYKNDFEMQRDMEKKEYRIDPAFRAEVEERIKATLQATK